MEVGRLSGRGDLGELVCEFLEVCIHQLLCIRELYPPEIFERRRHFNVPVQWARHPDLREYIHSAVTNLQPWIQQGVVDKVTLLVVDSKQAPVEKFVFRLGLKQPSSAGVPVQHLEFALRGFVLKLSASDTLLLPLPSDCSWELVAYLKSPSPDTIKKGQLWIPADDEGVGSELHDIIHQVNAKQLLGYAAVCGTPSGTAGMSGSPLQCSTSCCPMAHYRYRYRYCRLQFGTSSL